MAQWELKSKIGDYIIFDNIIVREIQELKFDSETPAKTERKKIASTDKCILTDFELFKTGGRPQCETKAEISKYSDGLAIRIECTESGKIVSSDKNLWEGDVMEIFFGGKNNGRAYSQFAFNPDGRKFFSTGSPRHSSAAWSVKTARTTNTWSAEVKIPFASIEWNSPKDGEYIPFNITRTRKEAKEQIVWSPVKSGFSDVPRFGRLLFGKYPEGMTRAQYEKLVADKEAAAWKEKFEKNRKRTHLVAPVGITCDFTVPFMPAEVFNPPEKIELSAAVNEIKPLAIALANPTGKTMEYRIAVEVKDPKTPFKLSWENGLPFPGATLRRGVIIRENENASSARLDPLVKLNEGSVITVPAKESGLLWIDFNTFGMKPGRIEGRLRVIPLNGRAKFMKAGYGFGNMKYEGDMTDLPLTLNIRDIELAKNPGRCMMMYSPLTSSEVFKFMEEAGTRIYLFSPWSMKFPLKDGKFTPSAPKAEKLIAEYKKVGRTRLFIGYSAYPTFLKLYGEKNKALFPEWTKTLEIFLVQNGIAPEDCMLEIFDEPEHHEADMENMPTVMPAAKKAVSKLKICLTVGIPKEIPWWAPARKKYYSDVDVWILFKNYFFRHPDDLKFIGQCKKDGKIISHYTCYTEINQSLNANFRRTAWFGEYHDLPFNCIYQAVNGIEHAIWKINGGTALLYHGPGYCIPSIRYMAVRQGMTDIKYLDKLRKVGKGNPEAEQFLKTAAKRVCVDYPHDLSMPDQVREEAAELILKIEKRK